MTSKPAVPPQSGFRLIHILAVPSILIPLLFASPADPAAAEGNPPQNEGPRSEEPDRAELLRTFAAEFVTITPGRGKFPESFRMGSADGDPSERPVHEVTLGNDFAMARYEVPQNLYEAVLGTNPSRWKGARNSVEMVSWRDAVRFCAEATKLLREADLIGEDEVIRLPTEAEWEYCCRAGTTTAYSFGDEATAEGDDGLQASKLDPYGWHTGNAAGNDPPVGALKPNAWGLYDMHGYLWEYTLDAWRGDYRDAPADGGARDADKEHVPRVIRGGSWRDPYRNLRSATRWSVPDHVLSDAIGFRCVKATLPEGGERP